MACTRFQSLRWELHLMAAHTWVQPVSSCEYSHPPCLIISPNFLHVDVKFMLATMFWLYSKSSLLVYLLCSLWKHLSQSHIWSNWKSRKHHHDRPRISYKCHDCRLHFWSIMLGMCVWIIWVISSSSHVSVCLQDHICIFHSFPHLVTLLKFWRPDSPLTSRPSNHHWFHRLSPRIAQNHQELHFKLRYKKIN